MKYSVYLGSVDVVSTDYNGNPQSYKSQDGNTYYITTGEKKDIYDTPKDFMANITEAGGEAEATEFGLSVSDYEAVALYDKNAYPLKEGTLVWKDSEAEYDGDSEYYTMDMRTLIDVHSPKKTSADYVVRKVSSSLNFTRAILKAINK